ncbi:hypothetical protein Pvag_0687 [Pantoea vagans C9-1]|nr:hypothetical protein Pvag_0687 [Pantoea vagans C9-1]
MLIDWSGALSLNVYLPLLSCLGDRMLPEADDRPVC